MDKRFTIIVALWMAWGLVAGVQAQAISVLGGNPTLTVTTATVGSEPLPVVDAVTTLRYRKQSAMAKITVRTSCPGQKFTLKVMAAGVVQGTAAPEVTLVNGMLDTDFINNIPKTGAVSSTITLQYTASATFAQGNSVELGDDVHTVTYTILAQ